MLRSNNLISVAIATLFFAVSGCNQAEPEPETEDVIYADAEDLAEGANEAEAAPDGASGASHENNEDGTSYRALPENPGDDASSSTDLADSVLEEGGDSSDYMRANCSSGISCIANCWGGTYNWFYVAYYGHSTCTQNANAHCAAKGSSSPAWGVCVGSLY